MALMVRNNGTMIGLLGGTGRPERDGGREDEGRDAMENSRKTSKLVNVKNAIKQYIGMLSYIKNDMALFLSMWKEAVDT